MMTPADMKTRCELALIAGEMVLRFEFDEDDELAALEKLLQETVAKKLNTGALVSVAPQFEWWAESGVWPRYPGGWTVLLRRAKVQGQVRPDVAAAARQAPLIKG